MHRYRLTRRFMLLDETPASTAADDREPASSLIIACTDLAFDEQLLRTAQIHGARILRSKGNRVTGPGADPGLPMLIERLVAESGVADIVVCGHSCCRQAGPAGSTEPEFRSPDPESWYQRSLRKMAAVQAAADRAKATVLEQTTFLRRLPWAERSGVRVSGWFYISESGILLVHDGATGEFRMASPAEREISERRPTNPPAP